MHQRVATANRHPVKALSCTKGMPLPTSFSELGFFLLRFLFLALLFCSCINSLVSCIISSCSFSAHGGTSCPCLACIPCIDELSSISLLCVNKLSSLSLPCVDSQLSSLSLPCVGVNGHLSFLSLRGVNELSSLSLSSINKISSLSLLHGQRALFSLSCACQWPTLLSLSPSHRWPTLIYISLLRNWQTILSLSHACRQ